MCLLGIHYFRSRHYEFFLVSHSQLFFLLFRPEACFDGFETSQSSVLLCISPVSSIVSISRND